MFTNKAVLATEELMMQAKCIYDTRCRLKEQFIERKANSMLASLLPRLKEAEKALKKARMAHFEALKQAELEAYAIEEKHAFDLWISDERFSNADFFPSSTSVLYWLRANPELA